MYFFIIEILKNDNKHETYYLMKKILKNSKNGKKETPSDFCFYDCFHDYALLEKSKGSISIKFDFI